MHCVAPFSEREERDGVAGMGDAAEGVGRVMRSDVEAVIDIRREMSIAQSRFAKGSYIGIPATGFEIKASKCSDGPAKRVADEDELVMWEFLQRFGYMREDNLARVEPGRVEARVDSAVLALGGLSRRRVLTVPALS